MYCPICAGEAERFSLNVKCGRTGFKFALAVGQSLSRAAQAARPFTGEPRKAGSVDYLCCPNCTADLEEYDARDRRLECGQCGFRLSTRDHLELYEDRAHHAAREE